MVSTSVNKLMMVEACPGVSVSSIDMVLGVNEYEILRKRLRTKKKNAEMAIHRSILGGRTRKKNVEIATRYQLDPTRLFYAF